MGHVEGYGSIKVFIILRPLGFDDTGDSRELGIHDPLDKVVNLGVLGK